MKTTTLWAATAALLLAAGSLSAQPGSNRGPGAGASAPAADPGRVAPGAGGGPGMRGGPGMQRRWGPTVTPGWAMMSEQERREHQAKMAAMNDPAECSAYMDEHHRQMVERANERHLSMPARPRRDACIGLKR